MTKKASAPAAAPVEPVASAPEQQSAATAEPAPAAPAAPVEPTPAAAPVEAGPIRVRVLAHCEHGAPNDVVDLPAAEVKALVGIVDPDPAAVAYAESLK